MNPGTSATAPNSQRLDPALVEIIRYGLLSITDQVEANLTRTAYSPLIYEYKDYCVGLLDAEGRIIAQSRGSIPIFLADLGGSIRDGLELYGKDGLEPGDVVITNYPGTMGQHLNNVDMYTPIFHQDELAGFISIRAHWADVGGRYVGSASSNDTTDIYQEGIQLRTVKLRQRGRPVEEIYRIVRYNTRFPEMVLGDIDAQLAGCMLGRDLFAALLRKYSSAVVLEAISTMWQQTEAAARTAVTDLPDGVYRSESYLDNDGIDVDRPIPIRVAVHIHGEEITVDLTGTADEVLGPFNSGRTGGGLTAAKVAFKYITTPSQPINDGSFRNLHLTLPDGTFLSARPEAAKARYSTPLPTVVDTIIRAFAQAAPARAAAGHHASMGSHQFVGRDPKTQQLFKHLDTAHGGWGAHEGADGAGPFKTLAHGDTRDIPLEVQEALYGLRLNGYAVRPDSAGPGKWRGGVGFKKSYTIANPCAFTATFERYGCPPWGLFGGGQGQPGYVEIEPQGGAAFRAQKVSAVPLSPGDKVHIYSGGGGGWGDPFERDVDAVAKDVHQGYVTPQAARTTYGVAITLEGQVDHRETVRLRLERETRAQE